MRKTIVFPRGGGGNWLSNLIHNLEQGCPPLISLEPGTAYDGQTRTKTIPFRHGYDIIDDSIVYYVEPTQPRWLFSTSCVFNLYLNDIVKVRLNPEFDTNILDQTPLQRFNTFTDSANYLLTDPLYAQTYYRNIDLDLALVFQQPAEFVDQLFDILDQADVKYTKDHLYAIESCCRFANTCPDPMHYIGNWQSVEWLAWCQAILMSNAVEIQQDLTQLTSLTEIAQVMKPYENFVMANTHKRYFTTQ